MNIVDRKANIKLIEKTFKINANLWDWLQDKDELETPGTASSSIISVGLIK